uniref:MOB kinase activator 3A n=1 Tax=Cyprinus carpio TaxID=7962 RepID=A0A8C1WVE4_CYPCA
MALCLGQVFSKDKTFRPRKRFEPGTQRFELYKRAQASLKSGLDLRKVVQLPDGENINDWINLAHMHYWIFLFFIVDTPICH